MRVPVPSHSSLCMLRFPLADGETVERSRVTIAFYGDGKDNTQAVFQDTWSTSPTRETRATWKSRGTWTGYTFFHRHKNIDIDSKMDQATELLSELSLTPTPQTGSARGGAVTWGQAACPGKASQSSEQDAEGGAAESSDGFDLVQ